MSNWKVVLPIGTTNKTLNPSAEVDGNFNANGAATMTRSTDVHLYGSYSYRIQTTVHGSGGVIYSSALPMNKEHYVTMRVAGTLPGEWQWTINAGGNYHAPTLIASLDETWDLYGCRFPAAECGGSTYILVCQVYDVPGDFYLDGIQTEERTFYTGYCDGDQEGCKWTGAAHASVSTRSTWYGWARDLEADFGLHINKIIGPGSARSTLSLDRYALIPGGKISAVKVQPRKLTLAGTLMGESRADLHAIRQELVRLFYDKFVIRYIGSTIVKQIEARYVGGLEGNFQVEEPNFWERIALQFVSPDPWWYGMEEQTAELDPHDQLPYYTIALREHDTGQWSNMGPPNPLGNYHTVLAIARAPSGIIYFGGHFDNWNNNVNIRNVGQWDPATGVYSPLGTGMNDVVRSISVNPDGTITIAGAFTDVAGGPGGSFNRVAKWDPVTSTFSALGTGLNDDVYTVCTGLDGTVYVGGYFTTAGVGAAQRVAKWNGVTWSALPPGLNSSVRGSAVGKKGEIYFVGEFNELFGIPDPDYSRFIRWNPSTSTWSDVTGGKAIDNVVRAVAVAPNGDVFIGGDFVNVGTTAYNRVARWNGTALSPLGSGVDNIVHSLIIGTTGLVYVGGRMNKAGSIPVNGLAIWNGHTWAHSDIDLPDIEAIFALAVGEQGVVNHDLYLGASTPLGGEIQAGIATVTNNGTAPVYPTIIFTRTGGTSARIWSVRNETTGKTLYFDYYLWSGETLTVTLAPTSKSIVSSAFGPVPSAILPGGDFGTFALDPGDNRITCLVNVAGAPTITATMKWYDTYRSFD